MGWRERIGLNWFSRAASPPLPSPAEGDGGAGSPPSLTTLPPYGNQWPPWGYYGLSAENLSVVTACIDVIASALASLPAMVFERLPGGEKREAPLHPVQRMIAAPNDLMTWPDVLRFLMGNVLFFGNGLLVVDRDGNGQPSGLYPVPWTSCQPILVPASGANMIGGPIVPNSRLVFDIVHTMLPWPMPSARPSSSFPIRYFADNGEVLYLRERTSNGVLGVSRLARAAQVVSVSMNAQAFADGTFAQGATLSGILKHPGRLGDEAIKNLGQSWRDSHAGPANAAKALILEEGMTFDPAQMTLESAQLAATREFQSVELCRLFAVPPAIVGILDRTNFATSEAAERFFATNCLTPWAVSIEREFQRSVFLSDRFFLELDLSGLTRGTFGERANTMIALTRAGIVTANEARHELGYDPLDGGDRLVATAVGGRPDGAGDGQGDSLPDPGLLAGGRKSNGSATLQ